MSAIPPVSGGSPPDRAAAFKGGWVPGVALALYALGSVAALSIDGWVETVTHRYPGTGAWYFVQEDFINGACMLVCLLVSLALAAAVRRRYPRMAVMVLALQAFTVEPVAMAAVIGLRTRHLFDPSLSTSPWPTLDVYLAFKGRMLGTSLLAWVVVVASLGFLLRRARTARPT